MTYGFRGDVLNILLTSVCDIVLSRRADAKMKKKFTQRPSLVSANELRIGMALYPAHKSLL